MGEQVEQLQRSVTSFRRQGSSGSVWDDKFLAGLWDQSQNQNESDDKQDNNNNERDEETQSQPQPQSESSSRSEGGGEGRGRQHHHRTVNVAPPSIDPPSPKVSTCGLCGFFAKPSSSSSSSGTRKFNNNNGKVNKRR